MTHKSQTDPVGEGRTVINKLCDEVERLRVLSNEGYQKLGSANNYIASVVSLIEAKAAGWGRLAAVGLHDSEADVAKREAWSARSAAARELATLIGEMQVSEPNSTAKQSAPERIWLHPSTVERREGHIYVADPEPGDIEYARVSGDVEPIPVVVPREDVEKGNDGHETR